MKTRHFSLRWILQIILLVAILCSAWFREALRLCALDMGLADMDRLFFVVPLLLAAVCVTEIVRRRLRLSFGVVAFTLALALIAFYYPRIVQTAKQRLVAEQVRSQGGSVAYNLLYDYYPHRLDKVIPQELDSHPAAVRTILGDDVLAPVVSVRLPADSRDRDLQVLVEGAPQLKQLDLARCPQVTAAGLKHVRGLQQLRSLHLSGTQATKNSLAHLAFLPRMEQLYLHGTSVTDETLLNLPTLLELRELVLNDTSVTNAGLAHLTSLRSLETLYLANSRVTDDGMKHVAELPCLCVLNLNDTSVSDKSIRHLRTSSSLRRLHIERTAFTEQGIVAIRKAMPRLATLPYAR